MIRFLPSLFLFLSILFPLSLVGQSKKELEKKKKKLQADINYTNELLNATRKNKKISLNQLLTINKKISIRKELISTVNTEIYLLTKEIRKTNDAIEDLGDDLVRLKKEYARMIYFAYINQDAYSRLMYIFASETFNQAYLRLKYFQQYSEFRKKHAQRIITTQEELETKKTFLEQKKQEKANLLLTQTQEKNTLTSEKQEKETVLSSLQDKEKQLKDELKRKKQRAKKLQAEIRKIIEEEIKRANAKKETGSVDFRITKEAKELSASFSSNLGKLPWPVLKGIITEKFGIHPHPLLKGIEVSNNGVNISTTKGALVRSVFKGTVSGVRSVPGMGNVIIVRHGEYLSVYANVDEVFVKTGDPITTKQNIGTVLHNANDSKNELHLEIWKGQTKLNPESWLYKN